MKRTINFLCISALLSLVACQEESSTTDPFQTETENTSAENSESLPSRAVIEEGARFWRACYVQLVTNGIFNSSDSGDTLYFSHEKLTELHGYDPSSLNVDFWIYLDDNNVPKYAIANESDSNHLLINTGGQTSEIVGYDDLRAKIDAWKSFVNTTDSSFVYVKMYRYEWSKLWKLLEGEDNPGLYIEKTAHTVESNSTIYEVLVNENNGVHKEGYITLDMILWSADQAHVQGDPWKLSGRHDFAMPCPKFCPQ